MMQNENDTLADQHGQANIFDDDYLVNEITANLKRGRSHWAEWRQMAREDFDFFAGNQWSQEDARTLKEKNRPAVVFNRIVRTINAVSGVELQNRQQVKYYPRKIMTPEDPNAPTDSGFADSMNSAADWVRDQNNSEDEESEAFQDCLKCGIGWTETRMDYDDDPQGMIVKDRIDPLDMLIDPDSKKRNFEDAKWVACIKQFTKKQIRQMFPSLPDIQSGTFWNDTDGITHEQTDEALYIHDYSDQIEKSGKYSVVQYQYWEIEPVYLALSQDGNVITFSNKKYEMAKELIAAQAMKVVKIKKKIYKQCFLVGKYIADRSVIECGHFTFRAITGLRDRNRNVWFGLIAVMKDPQRWANKWLSQIQHILNSNSKGGLLVEEGAVQSISELENNWAQTDSVIRLNPGGLNKILQKDPLQYPDGIDRLLGYAVNAINDIPGVNLEMLGVANRDQPIGLEMQRKNAGITILANFFDSLRRYRKMDGRILAYFIREYIADGRLIRILGEDGYQYVPLIKDRVAFDYDIVVDDCPTSPNNKEKSFAILMQVIPMAMQAGIPMPKELLDYMPLPADLISKWKKEIAEQSKTDPNEEAMQQQIKQIQQIMTTLNLMKEKAEIEKTESETAKNYATAEKEQAVGQEQKALAMQKFGILQNEHNIKAQELEQNQTRKDLELILNQHRKMLEVELDAQLRSLKNLPVPSLSEIR